MPEVTPERRRAILIAAAAIAFIVKLVLALKTYGTNDVYTYERFGLWSRYLGAELYQIAPDLNHPPSMLHFLSGLIRIADFTHVPFQFWLRFCGIVADVGTLWLVWRIVGERMALILIAIAPMQIIISGFHGNTDPVMIFFVVLAVWLAGYRDRVVAGGAAFGLAFCIKIAPVIAVPVLFFALPDLRKRIAFFVTAAVVALIPWSNYLLDDPKTVLHQVFGYKSSYGLWGVSWLLRQLAVQCPSFVGANVFFSRYGSLFVLLAVGLLSIAMQRMRNKPPLYTQMAMVFLFFFSFTSGFATQYLVWLTPWVAGLGAVPVALFVVTGSVFLLVVYNYWNLGMPWYLAIAYPWNTHQLFQFVCWASVVLLTYVAWRRVCQKQEIAWPRMAVVAVATLLIYPAVIHMRRDSHKVTPVYAEDEALYTEADLYHNLAAELFQRGRRADADAVESRATALYTAAGRATATLVRAQAARSTMRTPESYVDASLNDYNNNDFGLCVYDAAESLKLRPGMPAAWNNIALCNAYLGKWDEAIAAAREGFRLEPESDVVRQNLEWVVTQKKLSR